MRPRVDRVGPSLPGASDQTNPDYGKSFDMYRIAKFGLAPLLLAQGCRVRRTTPRLPEAAGLRRGEEGAGPGLRLLIVGDSAAAGVGVATQAQALSGRLLTSLVADFRVRWRLVAATGYTAQDVLDRLRLTVTFYHVPLHPYVASDNLPQLGRFAGSLRPAFWVAALASLKFAHASYPPALSDLQAFSQLLVLGQLGV